MFDANKIMEIRQKLNEVGAVVAQIQSENDKAKNEISKLQGEYTKARYEAKRVERQVKKEAAQEPKFEPYAAVGKGSGVLHKIIGVLPGDRLKTDSRIYPQVAEECVTKIIYPEAARDLLIELHGNPALDAVLDGLIAWAEPQTMIPGHYFTIQQLINKISSLRKSADTLKGGDGL